MKDMFEHYDELPKDVYDIISSFKDEDADYEECGALVKALNKVGWTCDYYLDASPFGLRPLSKYDSWSVDEVEKHFDLLMSQLPLEEANEIRMEFDTIWDKITYFIELE